MNGMVISHVAISLECKTPKISPRIEVLRESIGYLLHISPRSVGITATSGEGLTEFGKGVGIAAICILTVQCAD